MTIENLPEGFKFLPGRSRPYGISEKGEIFDVKNDKILIAPEGESVVTIQEESSDRKYVATFDIPVLLDRYFGESKGLSQEDFDELVTISGLPADVCRERIDAGWRFESTTDGSNVSNVWIEPGRY